MLQQMLDVANGLKTFSTAIDLPNNVIHLCNCYQLELLW